VTTNRFTLGGPIGKWRLHDRRILVPSQRADHSINGVSAGNQVVISTGNTAGLANGNLVSICGVKRSIGRKRRLHSQQCDGKFIHAGRAPWELALTRAVEPGKSLNAVTGASNAGAPIAISTMGTPG